MILTLEQIYQHYEHIARITLVSDDVYQFWTHQISLYLAENSKDYVVIAHCYDIVEEEDGEEVYIFAPDTCFVVVWRDYGKQIATHQSTIATYERLRDDALVLKAKLEEESNEQG